MRNVKVMWNVMLAVLHTVTVALVLLIVFRDHIIVLSALFLAVYAGLEFFISRRRPRPAIALLFICLMALWGGLLWLTIDAAYLAFPLFFVVLQLVGGVWAFVGVSLVVIATGIAEYIQHELSFGSVMGPVIGGAGALTLGLGFRYVVSEAHRREEMMAELVATRKEAVAASREAGEMAERARLAGDIHDTVAQGLSSIQLLLAAAVSRLDGADPTALDNIQLARDTASNSLAETRAIIAALQPQPLDGADLQVALARLCRSSPMGEALTFHVDGEPRQLPAAVEAAVVRIVQSAVANVVRHSEAQKARVTLTYQQEGVRVDIVDNGVGFDPEQPAPVGSVGMQVMRDRVAELGGTVTVETAPGSGTGISVELPCAGAA